MSALTLENEVSGFCLRCNYRPVEMSIQKLTPVAHPDSVLELEDGGAVIQEIDDYGTPIANYIYFLEGSIETKGGKAGWYTFNSAKGIYELTDKVFAAGEGFIYNAPYFENEDGDELPGYLQFAE